MLGTDESRDDSVEYLGRFHQRFRRLLTVSDRAGAHYAGECDRRNTLFYLFRCASAKDVA